MTNGRGVTGHDVDESREQSTEQVRARVGVRGSPVLGAGGGRCCGPPPTHLGTVLGFGCSHDKLQHWLGLRDQGGHCMDDCSEFGRGL